MKLVAPTPPRAVLLESGLRTGHRAGRAPPTPGITRREGPRWAGAGSGPSAPSEAVGGDFSPRPAPAAASGGGTPPRLPPPTPADAPTPALWWAGRPGEGLAGLRPGSGDSRVAHVDPGGDLVAGLAWEAVTAAAVREQVVEILHRELHRARHGGGRALRAGAAANEGRAAGSAGRGLRSRDPPRPAPEAGPPGAESGGARAARRVPLLGGTRAARRRADAGEDSEACVRGRRCCGSGAPAGVRGGAMVFVPPPPPAKARQSGTATGRNAGRNKSSSGPRHTKCPSIFQEFRDTRVPFGSSDCRLQTSRSGITRELARKAESAPQLRPAEGE